MPKAPDDENQRFVEGSGVSETLRVSLADPNLLQQLPPPWAENRDMIVRLFSSALARSLDCPGRHCLQCCKAQEGQTCTHPNWKRREDVEWYAQQINIHLSLVDRRIREGGPIAARLAADDAFELGCLVTEALIKFRWDRHAKTGKKVSEGGKAAAEKRLQGFVWRKSAEETAAAVDALRGEGMPLKAAYSIEAERQHVTPQTIRKQYNRYKKTERM